MMSMVMDDIRFYVAIAACILGVLWLLFGHSASGPERANPARTEEEVRAARLARLASTDMPAANAGAHGASHAFDTSSTPILTSETTMAQTPNVVASPSAAEVAGKLSQPRNVVDQKPNEASLSACDAKADTKAHPAAASPAPAPAETAHIVRASKASPKAPAAGEDGATKPPAAATPRLSRIQQQTDGEVGAALLTALLGESLSVPPKDDAAAPGDEVVEVSSWLCSQLEQRLTAATDVVTAALKAIEALDRQSVCKYDSQAAAAVGGGTADAGAIDKARRHKMVEAARRQLSSCLRMAVVRSPTPATAAQAFVDHISRYELPAWTVALLAEPSTAPPSPPPSSAAAPSSVETEGDDSEEKADSSSLQAEYSNLRQAASEAAGELARRVLPGLLAPLRGQTADSPTPTLLPLHQVVSNSGACLAIAAMLEMEVRGGGGGTDGR